MSDTQELSPTKQALIALKSLQAKLATLEQEKTEPIAVIGIGCRFPGGGSNPERFWEALRHGVDAIQDVPVHLTTTSPGTRFAALLPPSQVEGFDASYFGMSPREATSLDPQQRVWLEVVYEALESAGLPADRLVGSKTGMYVGVYNHDQLIRLSRAPAQYQDQYATTGTLEAFTAGRASYVYGLEGPSVAVDTLCSSSLMALHHACQALRLDDCTIAICGGVNLILDSASMAEVARVQALSPDGRCHTFDARANGYVRGDGCGAVVLKRLSHARRDGDRIMAVIRGTAVNQDGRSTGLTTPNVRSQQALVEQALRNARVSAESIGYVEAHGTGTSLGDPIEVEALKAVLGRPRPDGSFCVLGSVKANIGHTEGAAGVAGLIKTILTLQHELIPPQLHFQTLNPRIDLDGTSFFIPVEPRPWPRGEKPRFAGVNSFGLSGTNCHAILEEAPKVEATPAVLSRPLLLPLSAGSQTGLRQAAGEWAASWRESGVSAADLLYTASVRRMHHSHRLAVVAETTSELSSALAEFASSGSSSQVSIGRLQSESRPRVVFVFPGHGSQWVGMGRQLLVQEPVFKATLEACEGPIRAETGWSVQEELQAEPAVSRLDQVDVIQPILFAIEVALAALWRSWGVEPDAVIGHSMGEIAAAYVAGVLSMEDAARVICQRSRLLSRVRGQGAMLVVDLTSEEALRRLSGLEDRLCVAVSNAPRLTVISGDLAAVDELTPKLESDGIFCRRVNTDVAFHSPQMDPLQPELVAALAQVRPQQARIPLISTVTGGQVDGTHCDAAYWGRNLREPVRFAEGVLHLVASGHGLYVELSPHPILLPALETMMPAGGLAVSSLRRDRPEQSMMLRAMGALYTAGYPLDWKHLYPHGQVQSTPTYPWQRERYWIDLPEMAANPRPAARPGGHPLTGPGIPIAGQAAMRVWDHEIDLNTLPFLRDHRVGEAIVFPGAGYLEMALAAGRDWFGGEPVTLDEIEFRAPLLLVEERSSRVQLVCVSQAGQTTFEIFDIHEDNSSTLLVTGKMQREGSPRPPGVSLAALQTGAETGPAVLYAKLADQDLCYGPAFQAVERLWNDSGSALGEVKLPESVSHLDSYFLHPAQLDAAFHVFAQMAVDPTLGPRVPASVRSVRLYERPARAVWSHVAARTQLDGSVLGDVRLLDSSGQVQAEILGLHGKPLATSQFHKLLLSLAWEPSDLAASPSRPATWIIFSDRGGTGEALRVRLESEGHTVAMVPAASDPEAAIQQAGVTGSPCQGVIYLGWLDVPHTPDLSVLAQEASTVCRLVLALGNSDWRDMPRLWLVTRQAQPVGSSPSALAVSHSPLWGLRRTLAMEHGELRPTIVDLATDPSSGELDALLQEIQGDSAEEEVALRPEGRYVARLVRGASLPGGQPPRIRDDSTYLVSGGLGGLGLGLCTWLVAQGARHLILLGRRLPSEPVPALLDMEAAGAQVHVVAVDVGNRGQLEQVLASVRQSHPPLRGVFHAAGVVDYAMIVEQTRERFHAVFEPKVAGAWNLHELTQEDPLDIFAMYSSISAMMGSPRLASYTAANAFLDALAYARGQQGRPALSVGWGPFSQVGMAATQDASGQRLTSRGLESLTPERGLQVLAHLLSGGSLHVGVVALNVRQWLEFNPQMAGSSLFSRLLQEQAGAGVGSQEAGLRQAWLAAPDLERPALLEQFLRQQLAQVLMMESSRIDREAPFTSLGIDSLMSLELRNRLEPALGQRLPATLLWTYTHLASLAKHLEGLLAGETQPVSSPSDVTESAAQDDATRARAAQFVEEMSEEELVRAMQSKLAALKKGS